MQNYQTQLLTVDQYIKEIKLFNLGDFLLERFKRSAEKLYDENKRMPHCFTRDLTRE